MTWTLVTGGAKRLGAEICRTLAAQGHHIVVHYNRSQKEAIEVARFCRSLGVQAEIIQGDFSTADSTSQFLHEYLRLFPETKYLINNVGNYLIASAEQTSPSDWDALFQVNLHAPFACIYALLPSIKKYQGSILNLGVTGLDTLRANSRCTAYQMTKAGLLLLTRSLAKELAPYLVRVNMVSPGYLDIAIDQPQDPSKLPMHRVGTTQEVVRVIAFLLASDSQYITGQNIEIGGAVGL